MVSGDIWDVAAGGVCGWRLRGGARGAAAARPRRDSPHSRVTQPTGLFARLRRLPRGPVAVIICSAEETKAGGEGSEARPRVVCGVVTAPARVMVTSQQLLIDSVH